MWYNIIIKKRISYNDDKKEKLDVFQYLNKQLYIFITLYYINNKLHILIYYVQVNIEK